MPEPRGAARGAGASIVERIPLSPVGSRRVESVLSVMVSGFGGLFALQSLPALVVDWPSMATSMGLVLVVLVYGSIGLGGVAAVMRQWERPVFLFVGLAFAAALLLWPLAVTGPMPARPAPWLLALAGVPCGFVVIAFRSWIPPLVYLVLVASGIAVFRASDVGGDLQWRRAAFDGLYVLVLTLALLAVVTAARLAARSVDDAQGAALGRYADAQIDQATESERVRTDALVHDRVLTTFLSAAGAVTPEGRALAARMAEDTMQVLSRATVASHVGPKVPVAAMLDRIRADAGGIGERFDFSVHGVSDHFVSDPVADALVSAAVQAMTNSVKHAGTSGVTRTLLVQGTVAGGVRVVVQDDGRGFDPAAVASERLGLRVSIMERMRRAGGEVDLVTAPGQGATFVLSWPAASSGTGSATPSAVAVGA